MHKTIFKILATTIICSNIAVATAGTDYDKSIPMYSKGAATYYVEGSISGLGKVEFMVDTGSGYVAINEESLKVLKEQSRVHYVKNLSGILADGSRRIVPVYQIQKLEIGGCQFNNIEAAVFPGNTRYILGLSALKQASPFVFSIEPPQLTLSNCTSAPS